MCKLRIRQFARSPYRGAARWDVVVFIVVVLGLMAVLVPMIIKIRTAGMEAVCQANLRMIASGFIVIAADRGGDQLWTPVPGFVGTVHYVGLMDYRQVNNGPGISESLEHYVQRVEEFPSELTTSRWIWELFRIGSVNVESFVCPASSDMVAEGDVVAGSWMSPRQLYDFGAWNRCSYGLQVPFARVARPGNKSPADMPILADKGPFSGLAETGRELRAEKEVRLPVGGDFTQYNSPNHKRDGQNVFFGDGRVEYTSTPLVGVNKDNIYTAWQVQHDEASYDVRIGTPPSLGDSALLPSGAMDTLIYP